MRHWVAVTVMVPVETPVVNVWAAEPEAARLVTERLAEGMYVRNTAWARTEYQPRSLTSNPCTPDETLAALRTAHESITGQKPCKNLTSPNENPE